MYQLFFRYSFERGPGYVLYRLDHLTGATCETLPLNVCAGERVSFTPDPTPYPYPKSVFAPTPNALERLAALPSAGALEKLAAPP